MVGAGTLRAERVAPWVPETFEPERQARGQRPQPLAIAVSASAELPLDNPYFRSDRVQRLVLTTERAPLERIEAIRARATVVVAGKDSIEIASAMRLLREDWGVEHLLLEGGPGLNREVVAAGVLDEVFWTISPSLTGGGGLTLLADPPLPAPLLRGLSLLSIYTHENELFLRFRVQQSAERAP
jgi:5-amino-6-(5-phosphoribosylamino)uracil reductase